MNNAAIYMFNPYSPRANMFDLWTGHHALTVFELRHPGIHKDTTIKNNQNEVGALSVIAAYKRN